MCPGKAASDDQGTAASAALLCAKFLRRYSALPSVPPLLQRGSIYRPDKPCVDESMMRPFPLSAFISRIIVDESLGLEAVILFGRLHLGVEASETDGAGIGEKLRFRFCKPGGLDPHRNRDHRQDFQKGSGRVSPSSWGVGSYASAAHVERHDSAFLPTG
ncbi:hypothetical protein ACEWPM_004575 [Roseovarius sp. S4756]|uniref:hypothetical protein n=1 Tax=Roseovarius maritimus TaxID=3342637 RepID=UPI003726569E